MSRSAAHPAIDALRNRIRALDGTAARDRRVLPFGVEEIDRHLPGGGMALGALHEVAGGAGDVAHCAAASLFVAGILARLQGPVLWCMSRRDLFAPGLAGVGLGPDRVVYAETGEARAVLAVMEEGLRHGGLAGVVGEADRLGLTASRRLALAAEASGAAAFVLRRWRRAGETPRGDASAAATRWRIAAVPSAPLPVPGLGRARWHVELLRCRNGEPANWMMEACDGEGRLVAAGRLRPPAVLADRPAAAGGGEWRAAG